MPGPTGKRKVNRKQKLHKTHPKSMQKFTVAVIGTGHFGAAAARALKKNGHRPVVFEIGKDGPAGTSTKYSCHTHPTGSHYNRLPEKYIKLFIENYDRFKRERGDFLRDNNNSINGIVETDAKGQPSLTSPEKFQERCFKHDPTARLINLTDFDMLPIPLAIATNEERIINGESFKEKVRLSYIEEDIPFYYDTPVTSITRVADGYEITYASNNHAQSSTLIFDKVVNATGFQKFIPENFHNNPFGLEVVYQPVVGLVYEDMKAGEKDLFSLLLLDGANPCLMPTANDNEYFLTHCGFTLLASCKTPAEAWQVLNSVTKDFIRTRVQPSSEADLMRYVDGFHDRFRPVGFNGGVIAKPKTRNEFRLGFAFASPDPLMEDIDFSNGIIHLFPGKITSSLRTADEVVQLVEGRDLLNREGYQYAKDGMLDFAAEEIAQKPEQGSNLHNACSMQPYPEILKYSSNRHTLWKENSDSDSESRYSISSRTRSRGSSRSNSLTDDQYFPLKEVKY